MTGRADVIRRPVPVDETATTAARRRAEGLMRGLREREFRAQPERARCLRCDTRAICGHAACSRVDRVGE